MLFQKNKEGTCAGGYSCPYVPASSDVVDSLLNTYNFNLTAYYEGVFNCNFFNPDNRTMIGAWIPTEDEMPLCYYTLEGKVADITNATTSCGMSSDGGCIDSPYIFDLTDFGPS